MESDDSIMERNDVLEVLRRRGGAVPSSELLQILDLSPSTLGELEELGYIEIKEGGVWLTNLRN